MYLWVMRIVFVRISVVQYRLKPNRLGFNEYISIEPSLALLGIINPLRGIGHERRSEITSVLLELCTFFQIRFKTLWLLSGINLCFLFCRMKIPNGNFKCSSSSFLSALSDKKTLTFPPIFIICIRLGLAVISDRPFLTVFEPRDQEIGELNVVQERT